ncbi:sensor histidine kinase [Hoeflea prorocentri]|uniref:histidine kinase n=1 Tax=Hoeflea prorocentri TaxID=1922333 RepID=A0A9X3UHZ0_9HYPH|nr:ATP-binding protein [Hoeflea prorocentri]MCY6381738.1 ATP-binding protein [Hoeflea prorocentri]MDA5399538.1 ATP-binding protein [Hoeflea prorocentri]
MLIRRLYLQIYLTLIASLVLMVILSAVLWKVFDGDRDEQKFLDVASELVAMSLPPADAPTEQQRQALETLGKGFKFDVSLFDADGRFIAAYGEPRELSEGSRENRGWRRSPHGPTLTLTLPDGRILIADRQEEDDFNPLLSLLALLVMVALCVGIAAFPLVRRLTRRLEKLQRGVERIGQGDLSARVDVRGRDEVAKLASSFNEAAEKIEKLVNAHRLLLANASHELRTPLSRIRLGLEMSKGEQDPKRRAALQRDIAELDSLIDEILLMSRLDAGANINLTQTVDLVALAAEECARYENCDLSGSAPEIRGDQRLLHRLLANLLENAHKHGAPPVSVEIGSHDNLVFLTVRDNGLGIAEDDREKVFQPFYRGADRQNVNGYGLGLPLVRQIAVAHGGTVDVLPRSQERSAIRVSLPIKAPAGQAA